MTTNLKQVMVDGFSGEGAQVFYRSKAEDGLWISEKYFIEKYFTKSHAHVLDLGCGAGRTSLPLAQMDFQVTGVDIAPPMIATAMEVLDSAKQIARERGVEITYEVGDATALQFPDATFEYALFSNQGWSQIPGWDQRQQALREVRRVLKPGGIFIFTAHPRMFWYDFPFWVMQWLRLYILKPLGFEIAEEEYGDRLFEKEPSDHERTYKGVQYIHVPTVQKVREEITKSGFKLLESDGKLQISEKDVRRYPPVLYICEK
jgi:ubiquinone/menaquinone biosynthesis C-methylase UbiE